MTRVNCIPVVELTRQHLVSEYRELPRIFGLVRDAISRGEKPTDRRNPVAYTLGTGHCRFFYPRVGYLYNRQLELMAEMASRGYHVGFTHQQLIRTIFFIGQEWRSDWQPDVRAIAINRARIEERLNGQ